MLSKCTLLQVFRIIVVGFHACWLAHVLVGFKGTIISWVFTILILTNFLASSVLNVELFKIFLLFKSSDIVIIILEFQITTRAAFWLIKNAWVKVTNFSSCSSFFLFVTSLWVRVFRSWRILLWYAWSIIVTLQLPQMRHLFLARIK